MFLWLATVLAIQEDVVTEKSAKAIADEVIPPLEKTTGIRFSEVPTLEISTGEAIENVFEEEFLQHLRAQSAGSEEAEIRREAKAMARLYSASALGKFAARDKKVYILRDNFKRQAETLKNPRIHSLDFLRVVVIHELVHSLDEQAYGACTRMGTRKTTDEIQIWNALLEGHAQYVTHDILQSMGKEDLFLEFEKLILVVRREEDKYNKYKLKFSYVDGRAFFDGLAKTGRKGFVEDVFRNPPASTATILRSESYYDPKLLKSVDLKPLWEEMKKEHPGEWTPVVREVDASLLRAMVGNDARAADVERSLKAFQKGEGWILQTRDQEHMVMILVCVTDDEGAAKNLYDLLWAAQKASSPKAAYGELKTPKLRRGVVGTEVAKRSGREVSTRIALAEIGSSVVWMVYLNESADDATLTRRLEKICEHLEKK